MVGSLGRSAVLLMDGASVGSLTNFECNVAVDEIRKYTLDGGQDPAALEYGNKNYTWSADKLWVAADTFLTKILAGTKVTIKERPAGTGGGLKEITYGEAILLRYGTRHPQNDLVLTTVSGTARTCTEATQ